MNMKAELWKILEDTEKVIAKQVKSHELNSGKKSGRILDLMYCIEKRVDVKLLKNGELKLKNFFFIFI